MKTFQCYNLQFKLCIYLIDIDSHKVADISPVSSGVKRHHGVVEEFIWPGNRHDTGLGGALDSRLRSEGRMNQDPFQLKVSALEVLHLGGGPDLVAGGRSLLVVSPRGCPGESHLRPAPLLVVSHDGQVNDTTGRGQIFLAPEVDVEGRSGDDPVEIPSRHKIFHGKFGAAAHPA